MKTTTIRGSEGTLEITLHYVLDRLANCDVALVFHNQPHTESYKIYDVIKCSESGDKTRVMFGNSDNESLNENKFDFEVELNNHSIRYYLDGIYYGNMIRIAFSDIALTDVVIAPLCLNG